MLIVVPGLPAGAPMGRPYALCMFPLTYSIKALPWDIAIFLLIAGGIALTVFAVKRRKRILAAFGVLIALTVVYGSFVEPWIITVTEYDVNIPLGREMTIVALSDFHVGPYKGRRFVQRVVARVNGLDPDLVLLAGDYVYHALPPLDGLVPLGGLKTRYGVYAVPGNHEYGCYLGRVRRDDYGTFDPSERVFRALERVNVAVLRNESRRIETEAGELFIAGVDDLCSGHDDLGRALPVLQRKAPVILLSHDPGIILDNRALYPNLIVSGHTHGGQIRLPFIGPVPPLPMELPRSYDQGLFTIDGNTTLAITRGVGESSPRARLFAWPEVMVLKTKP